MFWNVSPSCCGSHAFVVNAQINFNELIKILQVYKCKIIRTPSRANASADFVLPDNSSILYRHIIIIM